MIAAASEQAQNATLLGFLAALCVVALVFKRPAAIITMGVFAFGAFHLMTRYVAEEGNTKKSKGAKRAYLRFVKAAQDFAPEDRDTAINDLRRLMDKAGTDGDNDVALQAARTYVGTGLVG
jgi:hypothetical protein